MKEVSENAILAAMTKYDLVVKMVPTSEYVARAGIEAIEHGSLSQPSCGKCNRIKRALTIDYRPDAYWADWTRVG